MSKKDEFKSFVSKNPSLIKLVQTNKMTWQGLYEIYDLYGDDVSKWQSYLEPNDERKPSIINLGIIGDLVKKADINSIQKHINTAQKAINLFQDMNIGKNKSVINTIKGPLKNRPINKFFED